MKKIEDMKNTLELYLLFMQRLCEFVCLHGARVRYKLYIAFII